MRIALAICAALVLTACQPTQNSSESSDGFRPGAMAEGAPPQLMHWGKLVGQWSCEEEGLKPDGSGWQSAGDSDWDFMWAYDGWGIQDNYFSPARSTKLDDESKRQRGVNLRIYNTATNRWVLTWLTTASPKSLPMTAQSTDTEVVMLTDGVNAQGQYTRYTFFDLKPGTYEWKMELSKTKENWREVYRIHCKK